eukprot:TRINITY_DN3206_c0_g1_i2.p1 TRINITY_DN3206_c0_g1~~TRINITY_DN3206_c0_g1_i2.p1  ORF type:complete len:513 (-),score=93.33 TRINITY_DN3206_c0_g1_i2:218-1756(-)
MSSPELEPFRRSWSGTGRSTAAYSNRASQAFTNLRYSIRSMGSDVAKSISEGVQQVTTELVRIKDELTAMTFGLEDRLRQSRACTENLLIYVKLVNTFSLLGVLLMVWENEILFANDNKGDWRTNTIKCFITITSIIAVYFLYAYYRTRLEVVRLRGSRLIEDASLPTKTIRDAIFEFLYLMVHPIPFVDHQMTFYALTGKSLTYNLDNILGAIMLFRVYLLYRTVKFSIGFHKRTIELYGKLGKVHISSSLSVKAMLYLYPMVFLAISIAFNMFFASYGVRLCEHNNLATAHHYYAESIWLIFLSITTIGYGDVTVQTYCGRSFVFLGWVWGTINTALFISVTKRLLLLGFSQVRVVTFLTKDEAINEVRHEAAKAIQEVWKYSRIRKPTSAHKKRYQSAVLHWRRVRRRISQQIEHLENANYTEPLVTKSLSRIRYISSIVDETEVRIDTIEGLVNEYIRLEESMKVDTEQEPPISAHGIVVENVSPFSRPSITARSVSTLRGIADAENE